MADVMTARLDELDGRKPHSKRRCLDLQNPIVVEEEEEEFEEAWGMERLRIELSRQEFEERSENKGENWINVSYLKNRYREDPQVDEKLKEQLDRHLDKVYESLGFDIDENVDLPWRYRWAYPVRLEDSEFKMDVDNVYEWDTKSEIDVHNIYKCIESAIEEYKEEKGIVLQLVELVKANKVGIYDYICDLYFITFKARNEQGKIKTYQTRVSYLDIHTDTDTDDEGMIYINVAGEIVDRDHDLHGKPGDGIHVQFFRQKPPS